MKRWILACVASGLVLAPLGWAISDRLEARNEFCVSCHLPGGQPLHGTKGRDFEARPAPNLVAAHRRAEPAFRCIDCHGGASFVNKLRVKAVAARDASLWLLGAFEEPDSMAHPLWDEDCTRCHASYEPERDDDFHAIADHNIDFAHRCVECHRSHRGAGRPEFAHLERDVVLPICGIFQEEF